MKITKETKIVYTAINATKEEQTFCKQILELVPQVIVDEAVNEYYRNHADELLSGFLEDIAERGYIDLCDYE